MFSRLDALQCPSSRQMTHGHLLAIHLVRTGVKLILLSRRSKIQPEVPI